MLVLLSLFCMFVESFDKFNSGYCQKGSSICVTFRS